MKRTLIRYKTRPDMADKNAELIAGVFAELKAAKPEGFRYLSLRLDDDTFVHYRRERIRFRQCIDGNGRFQGVPERNSRALHRAAAARQCYNCRQLSHAGRRALTGGPISEGGMNFSPEIIDLGGRP